MNDADENVEMISGECSEKIWLRLIRMVVLKAGLSYIKAHPSSLTHHRNAFLSWCCIIMMSGKWMDD